jgi:hypothetical protein
LYLRSGEPKEAETLILGMPKGDDPIVGFWGAVVLARAVSAQQRTTDAAAIYEALTKIAPGTQTVTLALASLRLKLGDRSAALTWAERARTTPADRIDPWTLYWGGDARFLDGWLTWLRGMPE